MNKIIKKKNKIKIFRQKKIKTKQKKELILDFAKSFCNCC